MNEQLRDALPDLVEGRLSELDTATLSAHVEGCAGCRAELALIREIRRAGVPAPRMDAAKIASAIAPYSGSVPGVERLPHRDRSRFGGAWKFVVMTAVIAAGFFAVNRGPKSPAEKPPVATTETPVVDATPAPVQSPAENPAVSNTQAVVPTGEKQVAMLSLVGNLQDLSDSDIEQLLTDLDGMETLPAADPESVTLSIDDAGAGQ